MPINHEQREYRSASLLEPIEAEEKSYIVEGYATTFDDPYELYQDIYEVISSRAFEETDFSDVIMQYDHEGKVLARNSNGTLGITRDDHGLYIRADLSKSAAARELYEEIQSGLVTRMSWAFTVLDDEYDSDKKTRTITRVGKVYDVSAVSIPANDATTISARSFGEGVIAKELEEFEKSKEKSRRIRRINLQMKAIEMENAHE